MPKSEKSYTTVIADDHEIIRGAIRDYIEHTVFEDGSTLHMCEVQMDVLNTNSSTKSIA